MSVSIPILIILIVLPIIIRVVLIKTRRKSKINLPPGPPGSPFVGNLFQLGETSHRTAYELSKVYGPILYMRMGQTGLVVVSSPALAREVLKNQDLACCTRPDMTVLREYTHNYCDVSAAPYGDTWRILRKVYILELLGNRKLNFFQNVRQSETDKMVESIRTRPDPDSPINIKDHAVRVSSSIVLRVTFGHMSEGEYGTRSRFHDLLDEANRQFDLLFVGDYFPGFGWIDWLTGYRARLRKNVKELDEFFQQVIDEHMDVSKRGEDYEEDFIDVMIRLCKEEGSQITTDHIKGSIIDIVLGGTDTVAAVILWVMTELARHPRVMKKAQEELRRVVGDKGKVEESDLPKLDYLKLVMKETLRLHPQNPMPRVMMQDSKIDGYDIPKGTEIFVNSWAISRDETAWENAFEFIPERFEGSSITYLGNDYEFLTFGAGRRMCPGINFGVLGVSLAIANLVYCFDWELPVGTKVEDIDTDDAPGFVTYKKSPLLLVPKNMY